MTWNRVLYVVATVFFAVLLIVSIAGSVSGTWKDILFYGGLAAFAGGHI